MVIDNIDNIFPNLTRHGKLRIVSQLAYEVMMIALEETACRTFHSMQVTILKTA
ncbi:MAG: hypothetical protein SO022_00470 [Selenomonadaceae bacterium]|nr:hypothetical protein [Selenomonadaceae bacterium]